MTGNEPESGSQESGLGNSAGGSNNGNNGNNKGDRGDPSKPASSEARPKGTPEDYAASPSKKGGGTQFTNPANKHDYVRDMPGNPNSPNPAQQNPYVKQVRDGRAFDKFGNRVDPNTPEAHIPRDEFVFRPK